MSRVYIERLNSATVGKKDVLKALQWLNWETIVPENARVFIKPNLTWPEHKPGVTTTPEAIAAVVEVLHTRTQNITVGESNGGYHSYEAEEAFQGHHLYELEEKYGARICNLSNDIPETIAVEVAGQAVDVTLPRILLHETDVFITMPVPKTHVMTGVSLAFKNQWGCIPSPMRLREHHQFDRKIIGINRLLKPRLSILDGTYFLNGAGPMTGEAVRMNLLIAGDDAGSASLATCSLMGINPNSIRHFRVALQEGMFPLSLAQVELNQALELFQTKQFVMRRAFLDWISLIGFRSEFFTKLFWDSSVARPLHKVLYLIRRNPLFERFLYGEAGTPPEWDHSLEAGAEK